ncbi:CPBP family intramembrane glutamic endopeptidase [Wukongibacter sp. M2B1]|uniref:CPBP family intramembrane glutamic endopeptidase n=1 Tax=Wukongibacter sp. M2B1 TaxID=3088895 RepID=UPI003D78D5EF
MEKQKTVLAKENRIFSLAKQGRYQPNVILAVLITMVILYGMGFVLILTPLGDLGRNMYTKGLAGQAFAYAINGLVIPFGIYILAFFAWVRLIEKRPVYTMGFEKKKLLKKYFRGFALGILMIFLCIIIFFLLGTVTIDTSNSSTKGLNALGGVLIVLLGWIVQGASEEIMVRGWLLPVVGVRHNVALGIFVSSTLFGALHIHNANIGPLPIINLILFGVFAALYVIWEGGLWGICALHSSWNWAQGNLFGFEVSGTLPIGGILIDFKPISGSDFITGGLFGIEGGIVCSIVLALGIFTLIFLIKRK